MSIVLVDYWYVECIFDQEAELTTAATTAAADAAAVAVKSNYGIYNITMDYGCDSAVCCLWVFVVRYRQSRYTFSLL